LVKKKKYSLVIDEANDFDIIGVCTHHSDYRLVWGVNEVVGLKLLKSEENYVVSNKKGETISSHSMYEFEDEENRLEYYLIKNKHNGKFLIKERPTIDYFLFLNNNQSIDTFNLMKQLKEVSSVLGVYPFEAEELPSVENIEFY